MGYDGSGNYTRQRNFSADASAGIRILASAMDQEVDDVASAFNQVLLRDGRAAATGNIPMGGNRFVNVGAGTNANEYMRAREFIENVPIYMTDTTTSADTVSVSASFFTSVSANQAPRDGTKVMVRMASHKLPSPVMRFSGHSANIHFAGGGAVDGFVSGAVAELTYNSAEAVWETYSERVIPRTSTEATAVITPTNFQYEAEPHYYLKRTGTTGDGVADDTAEIQAALNSGHKHIIGDPLATYLVSHTATTTINSVAYRYALTIPAGVVFDLNGATIKLADAQNTSLVAMIADDAALINGVLDSNRTNQTTPATGEMACVLVYDVDRIRIENIRAKNVRQYAGRFLNARNSRFVDLHCEDSYGDGWSLGTSGAINFELYDCFVDGIYAENCEGQYVGLEGNGAILTGIRTQVGSIHVKDSRSIKIQNTSRELTIDSAIFDGDDQTYGSANSGVKVQGAHASTVYPARVTIKSVISKSAYGNGLVINDCESVHILSYQGIDNGSGAGAAGSDQNDIEINTTNGPRLNSVVIDSISIDNPDAVGVRHQGTGNFQFGTISIRNPTGVGYQDTSSGRIYGQRLLVVDDQGGGATMTYAFQATGTASGFIGAIETNLTHSTSQSRVTIASGNYKLEIGSIRLGSTDLLGGVQALTNSSTTTAVTCGHVWRDFVGGSADYFHPIIEVVPWDATSMALGVMRCTVTDGSSGTGFTLNHASAATGDDVVWSIKCWKVVSKAAA